MSTLDMAYMLRRRRLHGGYHSNRHKARAVREQNGTSMTEDRTETLAIDVNVWRSVSNKHRNVARLPEGKTPQEALLWGMQQHNLLFDKTDKVAQHEREWIAEHGPSACTRQFLRCFTSYPFAAHLHRTLTVEEFLDFKRRGGQAA